MSDQIHMKAYQTITPYLIVFDVTRLLRFLVDAFDATERVRLPRADGSIMHADVAIGDSIVMMGEPTNKIGPTLASIYLRVDDADAVYRKAIQAGGVLFAEPADQPHAGERYGGVKDPCGNIWWPAMPMASA